MNAQYPMSKLSSLLYQGFILIFWIQEYLYYSLYRFYTFVYCHCTSKTGICFFTVGRSTIFSIMTFIFYYLIASPQRFTPWRINFMCITLNFYFPRTTSAKFDFLCQRRTSNDTKSSLKFYIFTNNQPVVNKFQYCNNLRLEWRYLQFLL